jgi:GxxExxY protein
MSLGSATLRFAINSICQCRTTDIVIDSGLRPDLLIADVLIVEVKAVERMHPVYQAQLMTYLKLMKKRLGLLINFNVPVISQGIKRVIL